MCGCLFLLTNSRLQSKKQTGSEMLSVNFEGAGLDHVLPEALSILVIQ